MIKSLHSHSCQDLRALGSPFCGYNTYEHVVIPHRTNLSVTQILLHVEAEENTPV